MITTEMAVDVFNEFSTLADIKGLSLEVHDYEHPCVASYEAIKGTLHVDITQINNTDFSFGFEELANFDPTVEDYLRIVMAHEFGHALDRKTILLSVAKKRQWQTVLNTTKNEKTRRQLVTKLTSLYLKLETNGWENGKMFISEELMPMYMRIYRSKLAEAIQIKSVEYANQ